MRPKPPCCAQLSDLRVTVLIRKVGPGFGEEGVKLLFPVSKVWIASEAPGGLTKTQSTQPLPRGSDSIDLERGHF